MSNHKVVLTIVILIAAIAGGIGMLIVWRQSQVIIDNWDRVVYMNISSSAFYTTKNIPSQYTCDGANVSPPLSVGNVPDGAKSLVLIMDDPDAPMGTWVHWTVWNIDPAVREVAENGVPQNGVEGMTSFGRAGYGGPCPPSGTHRYFFKLYALDAALGLSGVASKSDIEHAMNGHILEEAQLIGLYSRS